MRVDRLFLTSFYLSLAWASACLGYVAFLEYPWQVAGVALPLLGLLCAAYFLEGRWSMSIWVSNGLALAVAACAGLYFSRFFTLPGARLDADWPLRVLPHMGFWLLIMMVLKLFRPKHLGDYWVIYGMGLLAVGLGCLVESDFPLGLLLAGYGFTSAWSLALFYLHREQLLAARSHQAAPRVLPPTSVPWRFLGLGQALRRFLLVGAAGVLLFIVTPRHLGPGWEEGVFRASQLQTGLGDSTLDMNRTGSLRLSQEIAFEVEAEGADGLPKLDLDPGQRWRRNILNHYEAGRWSYAPRGAGEGKRNREPATVVGNPDGSLPDLGPEQFFLRFTFPDRLRWQLILADPVVLPPVGSPVVFFLDGEPLPVAAVRRGDGELRFPMRRRHGLYRSYRQVTAPLPESDVGPQVEVDADQLRSFRQLPEIPGLRERTVELLDKVVQRGWLHRADLEPDANGFLPPTKQERVARALDNYLGQAGEYTYSLELRRKDPNVDPVLDFLVNVKEGHCARYASALAAMLRTQGVPTRVVLGYRGADGQGTGRYVVRQSHAHSWVEVLVQRPGADGAPRQHWLTLDPTPGEEVALRELSAWGRFWRGVHQGGAEFWRTFVMDYNVRQQETLWKQLVAQLRQTASGPELVSWLLAGCLLLALAIVWRHRSRLHPGGAIPLPHAAADFYRQLLRIAARRCRLRPLPTQTPLEFAELLATQLRAHPDSNVWAEFPTALVARYYRVRYARQPLSAAEQAEVEQRLTDFDRMLSHRQQLRAVEKRPTAL